MVSSFSAVQYGPLFYRNTEHAKIQALKCHAGDYENFMCMSPEMKQELLWWITNLSLQKRQITHGNPDVIITCDASSFGWGAVCEDRQIGGRWKDYET